MKNQIVVVAIPHPTEPNLFLHGLRRDNGKWALPGGHASPGETMLEAARREAQEEAGLDLKELEACRNGCFGDNEVHLFQSKCPENLNLDSSADPDREFLTFKWLDPTHNRNLHVPSHKNILVEHINDFKKSELEKGAARRLFGRFNAEKELGPEGNEEMVDWTGGQKDDTWVHNGKVRDPRKDLPEASPHARLRMMNKISNRTKSRKNPNTGDREFLLHRQLSQWEFDKYHKDGVFSNPETHSSWTPFLASITESSGIYGRSTFDPGENKTYNHVVSAWIPEKHIKTFIPQFGRAADSKKGNILGPANKNALKEQEVIVKPGIHADVHEIHKDTGESNKKWTWQKIYSKMQKSEDLQKNVRLTVEPMLVHDKFDPRQHDFVVKAFKDGKKVGFGAFTHKKAGVMPFNMETHHEHRRQGIASNILDHAERISKKPVVKSPDMTLEAQMLWHHRINKSGDFIVEISLPIEADLLKSFFSPDAPGDVHPEKGYVAKTHPTMGKLFWHQNDETVKRHEDMVNQGAGKFLSSIQSPTHRKAMEMVINRVMNDPHRHFIPTEEHGKQVLRARHIKSLILGGGDVKLDTSDPNALRITRQSHSQYGDYKPITFRLNIGGKSAVSKSERNDGPATAGDSEVGWLRSILSIFGRRSGRDLKKSRTSISDRSRAGLESLRKTLSDDYKQKARSNAIILHPVTVNGKTSLGSGIPMHMTVKDFGDASKLSEQDMHNIHSLVDSNAFSQPVNTENIKLSPYRLRNAKNELQHILLVHGLPKHVYGLFEKTSKYGPQVPNYLHHIRIDDDTYKALKAKGSVLSAKDAGLEFHPAEFRIGHQVVKTYKP